MSHCRRPCIFALQISLLQLGAGRTYVLDLEGREHELTRDQSDILHRERNGLWPKQQFLVRAEGAAVQRLTAIDSDEQIVNTTATDPERKKKKKKKSNHHVLIFIGVVVIGIIVAVVVSGMLYQMNHDKEVIVESIGYGGFKGKGRGTLPYNKGKSHGKGQNQSKGKGGKAQHGGKAARCGKAQHGGKGDWKKDREDEVKLRAVLRIQSVFRGYLARKHVRAPVQSTGGRQLVDRQKVCLLVHCISGKDMPNVNTLGGCDPMVEFRIVNGTNPVQVQGGNVASEAKHKVQTQVVQNSFQPKWDERFELLGASFQVDCFLQAILWDYNLTGNTALGHTALPITQAIEGLDYNPNEEQDNKKSHKPKLISLLDETQDLKARVSFTVSYVEMHKYELNFVKASRVPKVDLLGTCDAFMEARVVTADPQSLPFEKSPGASCIWSGRTKVINNSLDPKWNDKLKFTVPGHQSLCLQMVLMDSGSVCDTPLCHTVIHMKEIAHGTPGGDFAEHKLKFSKLIGVECPDFKRTQLTIKIKYNIVVGKDT